jgi:hypothetical protein
MIKRFTCSIKDYGNLLKFKYRINLIFSAIAFVPVQDVRRIWDELVENTDIRLSGLVAWFEKFYIGKN